MKMEINGVQTELSVEEFVKLSELLEDKTEDTKEVTGFEIARKLIDELIEEEDADKEPEEFSVGDVVLVNDSTDDIGVITRYDEGDSLPYRVEYFRTGFIEWCDSSELHKLEGEELAEYNRDNIEEGDIVVITANTTSSRNQVGDIGKISVIEPYGVYVDVPERPRTVGCTGNGTAYGEMRLATEAEREQYEELTDETPKLKFKEGDKVRVIVPSTERPRAGWGKVKSGDVGVVRLSKADILYVDFENQSDWSAHPSELEVFDEEADLPAGTTIKSKVFGEVREIKGRDFSCDDMGYGKSYRLTNEMWLGAEQFDVLNVPLAEPTPDDSEHTIEVGDIVQVTENNWRHPVGTIGVVTRHHGGDVIVTTEKTDSSGDTFSMKYLESNVKLIAKHYDRKDV